ASLIEFVFINNYLENLTRVVKHINELHELGFYFGLNNFGMTNSSISQLKAYRIKRIKLSSDLIKSTNKEYYELVKLYRLLTRELKIKLVANQIEQESELQLIKALTSDEAQGTYFSTPLTLNQVTKMVK